jgi:DnaJ-class molecular chaperone
MSQDINKAYEVLSDPTKRAQYDMQQQGGGGPGGMFFGPRVFQTNMEVDPNDLINMFSNIPGFFQNVVNMDHLKQNLARPPPILKHIEVPLTKAFSGCTLPIEITRWVVENNVKREETETVYVPVPIGVDSNEIIVLKDKGNVLTETNRSDVKVFVNVVNDTDFIRHGLDLIWHKTISLREALCGFSFDMKYIDGRSFKVNNNRGTVVVSNYQKIIPRLGMKRHVQGTEHVGNLLINFSVKFPESLTEDQVQLIENALPL